MLDKAEYSAFESTLNSSIVLYRIDMLFYWLRMNGRILDLDVSDYGDYKCIAENSLGADQQSMTLYGNGVSDFHE